jgi:HEAT repeat protein
MVKIMEDEIDNLISYLETPFKTPGWTRFRRRRIRRKDQIDPEPQDEIDLEPQFPRVKPNRMITYLDGGRGIKSESELVRMNAAYLLGVLQRKGYSLSINVLLKGIVDSSPAVRAISARSLVGTSNSNAILMLVKCLNDDDPTVRQFACTTLESLDTTFYESALILLLENEDNPMVIVSAIDALSSNSNPMYNEIYERFLSSKNDSVQISALSAINSCGKPSSPLRYFEILEHADNSYTELLALEGIANLGNQYYSAELSRFFHKTKNFAGFGDVSSTLCRLGGDDAIKALKIGLVDDRYGYREDIAYSLACLGARESLPEIVELLSQPTSYTGTLCVAIAILDIHGKYANIVAEYYDTEEDAWAIEDFHEDGLVIQYLRNNGIN